VSFGSSISGVYEATNVYRGSASSKIGISDHLSQNIYWTVLHQIFKIGIDVGGDDYSIQ